MKIRIKREKSKEKKPYIEEFEIDKEETILNALIEIKEKKDNSFAFRCGCKTGVCGSCALRVNGTERLACKTYFKNNDLVEPLNNSKIIKDLIVDLDHEYKLLENSETFLHKTSSGQITKSDEKLIDTQSNCILCQSCFSSCPVYEVNKDFLGPYALTRALRYVNDKKESNSAPILEKIQNNGIWDCTLCGNCTLVCPQFIDPKNYIMNLRMKSVQKGYEDKSMASFNNGFDSGFDSFGGFNPNGF